MANYRYSEDYSNYMTEEEGEQYAPRTSLMGSLKASEAKALAEREEGSTLADFTKGWGNKIKTYFNLSADDEVLTAPVVDTGRFKNKYLDDLLMEIQEELKPRQTQEQREQIAQNIRNKVTEVKVDPASIDSKLEQLAIKYGIDKQDFHNIIEGESGYNLLIKNPKSSATGLFQFTTDALTDLNTTREDLLSMDAFQQIDLYEKYLDRWKFKGERSLGTMQAIPALGNKPDDYVVAKKGSDKWEKNAPWRPDDGGDITVGSINDYYEGKDRMKVLRSLMPKPRKMK